MQAAKDATFLLILLLAIFSLRISPAPDAGLGWPEAEAATPQEAVLTDDADPAEPGDAAEAGAFGWSPEVEKLQQLLDQELRTDGVLPDALLDDDVKPETHCGEELAVPRIVVIRTATKA